MGDYERFIGEGTSIKNAQRSAALNALHNTRLNYPLMKTKNIDKDKAYNESNHHKQTPVSELNIILMKRGIQPNYKIISESTTPHEIIDKCQHRRDWLNYLPHSYGSGHFNVNLINTINTNKRMLNHHYHHQAMFTYPPMPSFANVWPNFNYRFNTSFNEVSNNRINCNNRNSFHLNQSSNGNRSSHNEIQFVANLEFECYRFSGVGQTAQSARHSAAQKALNFLKNNPIDLSQETAQSTSEKSVQTNSYLEKSPVSLVYEIASKHEMTVNFELARTLGLSHIPTFVIKCTITKPGDNKPFLSSEADERSKKLAKKISAERMLTEMSLKKLYVERVPSNKPSEVISEDNSSQNTSLISSEGLIKRILSEENISNTKQCDAGGSKLTLVKNEQNDLVNSKSVKFLLQLTRNLMLCNPTYQHSVLDVNDTLTQYYIANQMNSSKSMKLHKAQCLITFEQNLPESYNCQVKSVGFGTTQRIAKVIATYICLIKLGFKPPTVSLSKDFLQTLQFSLAQNQNLPITIADNQFQTIESFNCCLKSLQDFSVENIDLIVDQQAHLSYNYRFLLFIIRKFYLFVLKNPKKHISSIEQKIETLFSTFHSNYQASDKGNVENKLESIKSLLQTVDLKKCRGHLEFFSNLLTDPKDGHTKYLDFKFHTFISETKRSSNSIAIISSALSRALSALCNFSLVKKNFVSFGIGCNEEEAVEVACLSMMKNLTFYSTKADLFANFVNEENDIEKDVKVCSNKSKASSSQVSSKQCITLLYDICNMLNVRKPTFETKNESSVPNASTSDEIDLCTECVLHFTPQSSPQSVTKLITVGIGNSKRLSRTVAAYLMLVEIGLPQHLLSSINTQIPSFNKYLQLSIQEKPTLSEILLKLQTTTKSVTLDSKNEKEIHRNTEFTMEILKNIYQSFLKNQKMKNPSHLIDGIERDWYEYHNHVQQLLDQSELFDSCSASIQTNIENIIGKFDRSKFWDHLQLISTIVSTQTYKLNNPSNPPLFQFKCTCVPGVIESESIHSPIIALISINCSCKSLETSPLLNKTFLSYAVGVDEDEAREHASYRALRYLAIKLVNSKF